MKKEGFILFSGGVKGAEAEFGANAERFGIEEVNFTFEGHNIARQRGLRVLNHEELKKWRRESGIRFAADESPIHQQSDISQNSAKHLVSD